MRLGLWDFKDRRLPFPKAYWRIAARFTRSGLSVWMLKEQALEMPQENYG
ncbi:MAG: hypothetical protein ABGX68_02215 [Methylococcales bacterium]